MIEVESGGNPQAMRYEPGYKYIYKPEDFARAHKVTLATEIELQKFSYGVLQIMGATARELGFKARMTNLLDGLAGFSWGVLYFARLRHQYTDVEADAVSAYNQGSPRRQFMTNKYRNQEYVDKVYAAVGRLSG
jgi:hypothetical protein